MRAEILSIGTELLLGQIVDTNANFLAQQLPALGLDLYYVSQIGDNLQRLADAFQRGLERSDVIITDRKSTRLNSSHITISYAVFCLKKKTITRTEPTTPDPY